MAEQMLKSFGQAGIVTLVATVLLIPGRARASEEQTHEYPQCLKVPTEAELNAAKGAFQAGEVAFREANYERAISYWEDAYDRDCTANALLLNLSRAYELAGRNAQAIKSLQTFLEREPNTQDKEQILRRIDALQKAQAAQPAAPPKSDAPAATESPKPVSTSTPAKKPILPLVVAGAGGVLAIGGSALFLIAAGEISDIDSKCYKGTDCARTPNGDFQSPSQAAQLESDGNAARSLQTVGGIVAGVGALSVISGITWYALSTPRAEKPVSGANVSPIVSRSFAGISVHGEF